MAHAQKHTPTNGSAQHLLRALVTTKTCITQRQLSSDLGWPFRRVQHAMETLRRNGMVERMRPDCYRATATAREVWTEEFTIKPGPKGRTSIHRKALPNTLLARVWSALRSQAKPTINDIITLAANQTEKAKLKQTRASVTRYLWNLRKFGYVRELDIRVPGTAKRSNGFKRFMLLPDRNTGPLPPRYRYRTDDLYDPNLRQLMKVPTETLQ